MKSSTGPMKEILLKTLLTLQCTYSVKFNLVTYLGKKNHEKSFRQCFAINIDSDVMVIDLYSTVYNYFKKP